MMKNNINKVISDTVNENYAYQGHKDDDIRNKPTKGYKYEWFYNFFLYFCDIFC